LCYVLGQIHKKKKTDGTIHNIRSDIVTLGKIIKQAHSIVTAIPNSHNLPCTITETLQKYTDLKEEQLVMPKTGIIPNKLTRRQLEFAVFALAYTG